MNLHAMWHMHFVFNLPISTHTITLWQWTIWALTIIHIKSTYGVIVPLNSLACI